MPYDTVDAKLFKFDDIIGIPFMFRQSAITKTHFIHKDEKNCCKACFKRFTKIPTRRPHHCRRCGDIFCGQCLSYRKKLDKWAQPDSNGSWFKVCLSCFTETDTALFGMTRSVTEDFVSLRLESERNRHRVRTPAKLEKRNGNDVLTQLNEKNHIDIPLECDRLLTGFQQEVGSSDTQKFVLEMAGSLIVPSWQKAKNWTLENTAQSCRGCSRKLNNIKHRNCRICALSLCKKCSYKELLIYYEDGTQPCKDTIPRLAVINVIGCPEKEPRYSLCVAMCKNCREYIVQRQEDNPDWFIAVAESKNSDLLTLLLKFDRMLKELMAEIHKHMEKITEYEELKGPDHFKGALPSESSKDQTDKNYADNVDAASVMVYKDNLQANLDKYLCMYQRLKKLVDDQKAEASRAMVKLTTNYLQARYNFYVEYKIRESTISVIRSE